MGEPSCFRLLEEETALELRRHAETEMGAPGVPVPLEVVERLKARLQEEPFLLEEQDIEDVIAYYSKLHLEQIAAPQEEAQAERTGQPDQTGQRTMAEDEGDLAGSVGVLDWTAAARQSTSPLPHGWERRASVEHKGHYYYYHAATKTSQWERPGTSQKMEPEPAPSPEPELVTTGANKDAVNKVHGIFLTESAQKKDADGKAYVMYGARVHVGYASGKEGEWWIFRRYSEWLALYDTLLRIRGGGPICPKPPPKKVLRNLDRNAVNRRLVELNKWLAEVTSNPRFSDSSVFIDWLHDGRVADAARDNVSPADLEITIPTFKMETEEGGSNAAFVYTVKITSSMVPSWSVHKRYSHFERLWELLAQRHPTIAMPVIPGKSVIVTTTTASHRRKILEKGLHAVYRVVELAVDEVLLDFLDAPPLIRATANGAPPTHQGELQVLGAGSIDTRWFVLRGTGLSYAREQFAQWEASLNLAGSLVCALSAPDGSSSGSAQVISIEASDGDRPRTLMLRAPDDKNLNIWLSAMSLASGRDDTATARNDSSLALEPSQPVRSVSFVSQRLSRGLSGTLDSPFGGREPGTPRGCTVDIVRRLEESLKTHAPSLPDLELTAAFRGVKAGEFVLIVKHETEYVVVRMMAPGAEQGGDNDEHGDATNEQNSVVVISAHAFHSSMRFSQPDRQSVNVVYKDDVAGSATSGRSTSFRMHTDKHAAMLLHLLQETHGIVTKQGLMAGLSGYSWVQDLFTGPDDSPESIYVIGTGAPRNVEGGSDSLISFWAPEGGWLVPPVAEANIRDAARASKSGDTTLEDALSCAGFVKLATSTSSSGAGRDGPGSSALIVRTSELGKKSVTYFDVGLCVEVHGCDASWSVARRFSHFEDLRAALRGWPDVAALRFPAKATKAGAVIGTDPKVVAARQVGLSTWLESVLDLSRSSLGAQGGSGSSSSSRALNSLACSPELLVFLGMSRAAQKQQELRRRASPTASASGRAGRQRLSTKMLDSTDRTGRSIEVLIQSQEDASSSSSSVTAASVEAVCDDHLAECAAFRCVLPKLLFDLKTPGALLSSKRKGRQLWLASDELELRVDGAIGANAVETIPYLPRSMLRVMLLVFAFICVQAANADVRRNRYIRIIEVSNTSQTEFKLVWYGEIEEDPTDADGSSTAALELEDMQEEVSLDSPDWMPSAASSAEQQGRDTLEERDELRPRREMRLQYSGAGPRTPRIAGEISDRKMLAEHIAKKTMQRATAAADVAASEQEVRPDNTVSVVAERKERLARHLQDMTGLSEEERIRDAVRGIIDGERAADAVAFAGLHKYVKQFAASPPEPGRIKELREMLTLVQRELLENRRAQLLPLLVQHNEENGTEANAADLSRLSLTQIVNQTIEEYAMESVSDVIWKCVCAMQTTEEATAIELKRAALRRKPQEFFGIEESNVSPSAWADAIAELNTMKHAVLPTDKLRTLLRAKDAVLATFSNEHPPEVRGDGKMSKARTLAGDDFQPIFIFMVCACDIPDLTPTCQLLWDLCDPKELVGEGGYYLTQFESAVYFISTWQPDSPDHELEDAESSATRERDGVGVAGMLKEVMPAMPAESVSEDSPAVVALEAEILGLQQQKQQEEASASVALNEGARRKARSKAKKLEVKIGELRALMNDSARQEAYFSAKESGVTVAWPIGLSTTAAVDLNAAVPALGDLPTKLSALSDILEEAGATDDDVEEMLDSSDPREATHVILQRLKLTVANSSTAGIVEEGVPPTGSSSMADPGRDGEDSDSDECL